MRSFQLSAVLAIGAGAASSCKKVDVVQDLNLTEFMRATWYIQKQQVNGYQPLESLNCVVATYNETFQGTPSTVPLFGGTVLTVFNDCNKGGKNVNVSNNFTDPDFKRSFGSPLCARAANKKEPAKLSVAPCKLPNILSGDYWVLEAGPSPDNYKWAMVMAGNPTVELDDGCTTPDTCSGPSQTGCGFWLFHREPVSGASDIEALEAKAHAKGLSTQKLVSIDHTGCTYAGMEIKANERAEHHVVV